MSTENQMQGQPILVLGHRNPDTDSICSAIAYAHLKQILTGKEVIAGRVGKVNQETQFILEHFGVEPPPYIPDLYPRVSSLLTGEAAAVLPSTPLKEVGILTANRKIKSLPIVDEDKHLLGILTLGDIAHLYIEETELQGLENLQVTLDGILRTLGGRLLVKGENKPIRGKVLIGAMNPQTMTHHIAPGDVIILGDREEAQLVALEAKAGLLIITGGYGISPRVEKAATQLGTPVLSVPYDTYRSARLLTMSAPVSSIKHENNVISFNQDDLVEEVKKVMLETRFRSYPVVDDENKLLGVISRYHLLALTRRQIILVDHNEKSQAVKGLEQAEILEIIDHHRVGDISTGEPIYFRNEPVGCTATIVATIYRENGVEIPKEMAGLMMAAILSDTVLFKSPTCTRRDREMAFTLAEIAGLDPMVFGREMIRAGSSLAGRTPEEIIYEDFKEFHFGNTAIGVGQVETMDVAGTQELRGPLLEEMETIRRSKGFDLVLLMLTDILQEGTHLLVAGPKKEIVEKAFKVSVVDNGAYLPGVMSRKKQVIPPLSAYLGTKE